MVFTKVPGDFAPLYGPLCFAFSDDQDPRDLDVRVTNLENNEELFVKHLYQTNCGEINLAPLLRRVIRWDPQQVTLGLSAATHRTPRIQVSVENATVTKVFLPAWHLPSTSSGLISTLPTHRILERGACEELFLTNQVNRVQLLLYTPNGKSQKLYQGAIGVKTQLFRFDSTQWPEEVVRAEVQLLNTFLKPIETIHYSLIEPPAEAIRLAWVSRLGSIEHYTFPVVKQISIPKPQESVKLADGRRIRLTASNEELITVTSAFEEPKVIEALSEIITSQQVWRIDQEGNYHEIGILEEPHIRQNHGKLSTLQLTLIPSYKQFTLWN